MAGGIALASGRPALDHGAGGASFDYGAARGAVPDAGHWPAVDGHGRGTGDDFTVSVKRAVVAMADQNDWGHFGFPFGKGR